jgi:hypothetical protein
MILNELQGGGNGFRRDTASDEPGDFVFDLDRGGVARDEAGVGAVVPKL